MEGRLNASTTSGSEFQEDKSDGSFGHNQELLRGGSRGQFDDEANWKSSPPNLIKSSGINRKEDKEFESAKAEMTEVREENARLKTMLQKIEDDYRSLHTRFIDMIQQQEPKNNSSSNNNNNNKPSLSCENIEEPESFVSLRLGRTSPISEPKRDDHKATSSSNKTREDSEHRQLQESLKLGLDYNLEGSKSECMEVIMAPDRSPENSVEEITKDEEAAGETWPPSKVLKTERSTGEEDIAQQASVKRARVSVRARCDTPTMNDGCQWRKYGQKIAKGNPCPRAYYRCTVAAACPVRKQVQRCAEDMSILITTYEGTHNHPLPIAATAMASTTSAAASMLISGSSTSQPGLIPPATAATAGLITNNLHGLNFSLSDNSRTRPFHFPNTSSSALPFPTITLDLTSNSTPSHHSNLFSSVFPQSPKYPSNSLSFSNEPNMVPTIWGNGYLKNEYSSNTNIGSVNFGRSQSQLLDQFNNYQKNNSQASSQQVLTETLTKAITSDPSFRSVIAAAISSLAAEGGGNQGGGGESMGQNLKWGETMQAVSSNPLARNGKLICAMNYLNHQQPPLPFSLSKNNSKEAAASRDQMN